LKYQRFKPSGCKDIGIRRFEFVAKTQFLYLFIIYFIVLSWSPITYRAVSETIWGQLSEFKTFQPRKTTGGLLVTNNLVTNILVTNNLVTNILVSNNLVT